MNKMSEHFIIKLNVSGREYRLKIKRSDEEKFRKAAVAIERKANQYRSHFAKSGAESLREQDYLTMTAIQALSETEGLRTETQLFEERVKSLIDELDIYLKQNR